MKRSSLPYLNNLPYLLYLLLYLLLIVLLLPLAYGHEEGAQAISRESLIGPLYAFIIIVSAIIIARIIKKSNILKMFGDIFVHKAKQKRRKKT